MYLASIHTITMELFAKIVNGNKPLAIFAKSSISKVWLGSEYSSNITIITSKFTKLCLNKV